MLGADCEEQVQTDTALPPAFPSTSIPWDLPILSTYIPPPIVDIGDPLYSTFDIPEWTEFESSTGPSNSPDSIDPTGHDALLAFNVDPNLVFDSDPFLIPNDDFVLPDSQAVESIIVDETFPNLQRL